MASNVVRLRNEGGNRFLQQSINKRSTPKPCSYGRENQQRYRQSRRTEPLPVTGKKSITPADSMPGDARTRRTVRSKKALCCSGVANFLGGTEMVIVRSLADPIQD